MKKAILVIIAAIIALLGGCAINKAERAEIETACAGDLACIDEKTASLLEQKEYEYLAKREADQDEIRQFIINCEAQDKILVYTGYQSVGTRSRRRGEIQIPRHAHITDYQCGSRREVQEALERAMRGYY